MTTGTGYQVFFFIKAIIPNHWDILYSPDEYYSINLYRFPTLPIPILICLNFSEVANDQIIAQVFGPLRLYDGFAVSELKINPFGSYHRNKGRSWELEVIYGLAQIAEDELRIQRINAIPQIDDDNIYPKKMGTNSILKWLFSNFFQRAEEKCGKRFSQKFDDSPNNYFYHIINTNTEIL
jgi:hypothetical protein